MADSVHTDAHPSPEPFALLLNLAKFVLLFHEVDML